MAENKNIEVGGRLHSIATGNVIAGANEILDDAKGKKQSVVNAENDIQLASHESRLNAYTEGKFVTVSNYSALPATGAVDTVYRVSSWDGTANNGQGAVDVTKYSEYAWQNGAYKFLDVKTQIGEVFDISEYNGGAVYTDLKNALGTNGINVPSSIRRGGMSVKFKQVITPATYTVVKTEGATEQPTGTELQSDPGIISGTYTAGELSVFSTLPATLNSSLTYYLTVTETVDEQEVTTYTTWVITYVHTSDNNYTQARCMAQNFTTDVTQWQGVDDVPTAESENLVKSGGVARGMQIEEPENNDESVVFQSEFGLEEYARINSNGISTKAIKADAILDENNNDLLPDIANISTIKENLESVMSDTSNIESETVWNETNESVVFQSDFGIEEYARIDNNGVTTKSIKADLFLKDNRDIIKEIDTLESKTSVIESKTSAIQSEENDDETNDSAVFCSDFGAEEYARVDNEGVTAKQFKDYNGNILSATTDKTLLVSNVPADAATVGSKFNIIPSYYHTDDYIENKVKKIRDLFYSDGIVDAFAFFTDAHYNSNSNNKTARILTHLLSNTYISKVVFGGDVCSVNTGSDKLFNELDAYNSIVYNIKKDFAFYALHGNHDYYEWWTENGERVRHVLPKESYYNDIFVKTESGISKDSNDKIGCYYYFDNVAVGIRYIVLDTSYNGSQCELGDRQVEWLSEVLYSTPDNLDIFMITHVGFVNGTVHSSSEYNALSALRAIIDAYNWKTTWTFNGESYDYSGKQNKIYAAINGHSHEDMQNFRSGVVHISTACSARFQDIQGSPMRSIVPFPNRVVNTITEDCIDVFVVNKTKNVIDTVRIGAGFDRKYHISPITLQVGNSVELTSVFSSVIAWIVNDNSGATYSSTVGQDGENWSFTHNIASISNGVVTGLSTGECYAVAIDANGDKEFFYIKVID